MRRIHVNITDRAKSRLAAIAADSGTRWIRYRLTDAGPDTLVGEWTIDPDHELSDRFFDLGDDRTLLIDQLTLKEIEDGMIDWIDEANPFASFRVSRQPDWGLEKRISDLNPKTDEKMDASKVRVIAAAHFSRRNIKITSGGPEIDNAALSVMSDVRDFENQYGYSPDERDIINWLEKAGYD